MKKLLLSLLILSLAACKSKNALPKPFTKQMLGKQVFSINTQNDTALTTVHGTLIRIIAGSFTVKGKVDIEIREAFTPAEMLAAGLTTESDGKPLRSAGMIYLNALVNGKAVGLVKPIKISMPNNFYDPQMKLFKGVESDSGTINWVEPVSLDTTVQVQNFEAGKALYLAKCANCHRLFSNTAYPALADLEYRGPWQDRKTIHKFIQNPARFMATDFYTQKLKSQYGSMMTAFPDLTQENTNAILDYIKNETIRPGARQQEEALYDRLESDQEKAKPDTGRDASTKYTGDVFPCKDDTVYIPLPKQNESFFAEDLSEPAPVSPANPVSNEPRILTDVNKRDIRFTDPNPTGGMYDFEIRTLGWYNIDAAMEGYAGTTNVKIWAQVRVDFDITMHVYLFCPDKQILSVGYEKQGDKYYFNKINGGAPLFLRDRAILFAFGSKGDQLYYGISEFNIQGEQTIQVTVKQTTMEEIRDALLSRQMNGIDLGIEKKEQKIIRNNCPDSISTTKDTLMEFSPK